MHQFVYKKRKMLKMASANKKFCKEKRLISLKFIILHKNCRGQKVYIKN